MNDVRLPIETTRDGNKITKVCVEDVYKIVNRIIDAMDKAYNDSEDVLDSIKKKYWSNIEDNVYYEGHLIIGNGTSEPCESDTFDEKIGNDIAFMKAKLNANIKKYNMIRRIYNNYVKAFVSIGDELDKISEYITLDIDGVREFNPDFMKDE